MLESLKFAKYLKAGSVNIANCVDFLSPLTAMESGQPLEAQDDSNNQMLLSPFHINCGAIVLISAVCLALVWFSAKYPEMTKPIWISAAVMHAIASFLMLQKDSNKFCIGRYVLDFVFLLCVIQVPSKMMTIIQLALPYWILYNVSMSCFHYMLYCFRQDEGKSRKDFFSYKSAHLLALLAAFVSRVAASLELIRGAMTLYPSLQNAGFFERMKQQDLFDLLFSASMLSVLECESMDSYLFLANGGRGHWSWWGILLQTMSFLRTLVTLNAWITMTVSRFYMRLPCGIIAVLSLQESIKKYLQGRKTVSADKQ